MSPKISISIRAKSRNMSVVIVIISQSGIVARNQRQCVDNAYCVAMAAFEMTS